MTVESDAQKDLALSDEEAENVVGGKKTKSAKHTKAPTYPVEYIHTAGSSSPQVATDDPSDCDPTAGGSDTTGTGN
jgi:hypothetical protein